MSITSTYPVRFRLLKHVIREEGYIFHREAKRVDIADFLQGVKRHTPFKFRVPGQTVARITKGQCRRGYIRIGCQEFIGKDAELLRDWALRSRSYSRRRTQRQRDS
jgi:hypothetical protein